MNTILIIGYTIAFLGAQTNVLVVDNLNDCKDTANAIHTALKLNNNSPKGFNYSCVQEDTIIIKHKKL